MAMLIAVNCAEPSRATVTAVGLDVAEVGEVVDAALEDRVDEEDAVDERLEAVLDAIVAKAAEPEVDDAELDWLTVERPDVPDCESDWAAAKPISPIKPARKRMLVTSNEIVEPGKKVRATTTPY